MKIFTYLLTALLFTSFGFFSPHSHSESKDTKTSVEEDLPSINEGMINAEIYRVEKNKIRQGHLLNFAFFSIVGSIFSLTQLYTPTDEYLSFLNPKTALFISTLGTFWAISKMSSLQNYFTKASDEHLRILKNNELDIPIFNLNEEEKIIKRIKKNKQKNFIVKSLNAIVVAVAGGFILIDPTKSVDYENLEKLYYFYVPCAAAACSAIVTHVSSSIRQYTIVRDEMRLGIIEKEKKLKNCKDAFSESS